MTPEEIDAVANAVAAKGLYGPLWLVIGAIISAVVGYAGAYLREKGKNAATKEDIKGITESVKSIEHRFSTELEMLRGKHALRAAAIDKRLATHQEAYSLWIRMMHSVHEDTIQDVVRKCEAWWNQNCLYLSPDARKAFRESYIIAVGHHRNIVNRIPTPELEEDWGKVRQAGPAIVQGVDLPPLGEDEFSRSMNELPKAVGDIDGACPVGP